MAAPTFATVHMSLDPGTLGTLSRRGHARLRQLQSQTPEVRLSLDNVRSALLLTGPANRMDHLRQQVAGLLGRPKKVPVALWAELMHTRKSDDGLVARLQRFSGSRIHIDRDKYELCIYGSDEQFSIASRLLDVVEKECIRERLLLDTSQIGQQQLNDLSELAEASSIAIQVKENEIIVLGTRDAVKQAYEKGFLKGLKGFPKALSDNDLLDDQLSTMGALMHAKHAAQGFARQTTEGTLNSSMCSGQQTAEGQSCCRTSSGQGVWSRQQTAEFLEDQVSCQTSVSTADSLPDRKQLLYERCLGRWIPVTVSSTALSASGRVAPSVTSSSLRQGQLCPFCGIGVCKDASFCFACGQLVKATPSIQSALEAASFAQPQQRFSLSDKPLMQATMLPTVISRESV